MAKFEEGDTVVITQTGFYRGIEATVEENLGDGNVIVDLPAGYYNSVVAKSDGSFGYPWHGEGTKATFHEDELVDGGHKDADEHRDVALEVAENPSEFATSPWMPPST